MQMSTSSSSDDEGDAERKRKLQEAVCGVDISSAPLKKKSKSSNRTPAQQEASTSGQLVTREMQDFLSRKLSEFLDSHYETTECSSSSMTYSSSHTSNVKLLSDSRQPILLEKTTSAKKTTAQTQPTISSDSESSDCEEETIRLQEAAMDTETILNSKGGSTKYKKV